MIFKETKLKGAYILELEKHGDERGFFARAWCQKEFEEHGLPTEMVQGNISRSRHAGTLRGMHYQRAPYGEDKLIQCTKGAIYDVIVDMRSDSPTYLDWLGVELTAENYKMLFVPKGFAHGYLTLEDGSEAFYLVSQFYAPGYEEGVRYDDPAIGIEWPREVEIVSEKDQSWPYLEEAEAASLQQ